MSPHGQPFALGRLEPRPWKNGAGTTREIAVHPPGAGSGDFEWRMSVAEVDRPAPFSAYPGIDRVIVLIDGPGLRLRGMLEHELVRAHVPFAFAGEAVIDATPVEGSTQDFNLMTRRDAWRAEVDVLHTSARVAPADAGLVLCLAGRFAQPALGRGDGLLWRGGLPAQDIRPQSEDAVLLVARCLR